MSKGDFFNKKGGVTSRTIIVEVPVPTPTEPNEFPNGIFGTAVNGNATINTNTTLTQDLDYENLTIGNAVVTIGWNPDEGRPARIRVNGTLHFSTTSGRVTASGNTTRPTRPLGGVAGAGGTDGGDGATVNPSPGNPSAAVTAPSIGSKGSNGSDYSGEIGGVAGAVNRVTLTNWQDIIDGKVGGVNVMGGSGGGGGAKGGAATTGGGGGGGGVIWMAARNITEVSPIVSSFQRFTANGGLGQTNSTTGPGSGVGGAGGCGGIILITENIQTTIGFAATPGAAPVSPTGLPTKGHVYLASKFTANGQNPYDFEVDGYFHPIEVV